MNDEVKGPLRAIVPALVTYLVAKGYIPEALSGPVTDLLLVVLVAGAAVWSWVKNRRGAKVAAVAAMAGTTVSPDGRTITIVNSDLASAARVAATNAAGV